MRRPAFFLLLLCAVVMAFLVIRHLDGASVTKNEAEAADAPESTEEAEATFAREAVEWRRLTWQNESGDIPTGGISQALQARDQYLQQNLDGSGFGDQPITRLIWTSRGPNNVGGRTRAIVVDPTPNSKTIWAGSVGGGVWKSTDGGDHWLPLNDVMQNYIVNCLTLDPNDPSHQTLYAGTGEDAFNLGTLPGGGIFKSTNGGLTWMQVNHTSPADYPQFKQVNRISIKPGNPHGNPATILASTWDRVVLTTDEGFTEWNTVELGRSNFVSFDPNDGTHAVAEVMTLEQNKNERRHRAMFSKDGGFSFQQAKYTDGSDFIVPNGCRIEFAYYNNSNLPGRVYAINHDDSISPSKAAISFSQNGGDKYVHRESVTPMGTAINPSDYAVSLWVSPTSLNVIVAGGYNGNLFRSTDDGDNFVQISSGQIFEGGSQPHLDQHCIVSGQGYSEQNRKIYVCNDGGVYAAPDVMAANVNPNPALNGWENKNYSYRTSQYYAAAGNILTPGVIYGGLQDNGTTRSTWGNLDATAPFGGDGGFSAVDASGTHCYGEYTYLTIHRSDCSGVSSGAAFIYCGVNAAHCWPNRADGQNRLLDAVEGFGYANPFAPFILDPNDPNRIVAGGISVWRTDDAQTSPQPSWRCVRGPGGGVCPSPSPTLTPTVTPSPPPTPPMPVAPVSAIAIAPGHSNIMWVAYNNSTAYKTTEGLLDHPTWTQIDGVPIPEGTPSPTPAPTPGVTPTPNPFARYVTRILIDKDNPDVVYVAQAGFSNGNLLKTTDGGTSWNDITGTGFPNVPVRGIARHPDYPNKLYVGTEIGLYSTANGGQGWLTEVEGPAKVSVDEVAFMQNSTVLLAATHGRGVWTAYADPTYPANSQPTLYDFDGDGRADTSVFRPSTGDWHLNRSAQGYQPQQLGVSTDIPSAADFDGDGKTDMCVFRPSNGTWYWIKSSNGTTQSLQYGQNHDVPVPGDFDHDGLADQAVFRADHGTEQGLWYVHLSGGGEIGGQWGIDTDWPIAADFNGDGYTDFGVFRLKDGYWWLLESGNWRAVQWGQSGDIPVAADFTGDGAADIAVFRPMPNENRGDWWIIESLDPWEYQFASFGYDDDIPVPADYDGDGKADIAVFRPSDGTWYLMRSTSGFAAVHWGSSGDFPIPKHVFVQ